jgi:hypothetical protein
MLIAAVLCLCAAAATAALGVWALTRPRPSDPVRQVLRAVGQLVRRWLAERMQRHTLVTKSFDRGSTRPFRSA